MGFGGAFGPADPDWKAILQSPPQGGGVLDWDLDWLDPKKGLA